ncbi:MAG: amylo-alpha-1,6-glucosidase [Desulfotomaculales bacterium]
MRFGKEDWPDFNRGTEHEWLVTNGLGGYASSTLIGANTRKYHGLLVAALSPPVERTLLLAKLDERAELAGQVFNLATNQTVWGVTESGFIHLQQVVIELFPYFIYSFADVFVTKHIFMIHGENTTVVMYRIQNGDRPLLFHLVPLVNCRNFHWTTKRGLVSFRQQDNASGVTVWSSRDVPALHLACSAGRFEPAENWFYRMFYRREEERGLEAEEDHYMPGSFTVALEPHESKTVTFLATTEGVSTLDGRALLFAETKRLERVIRQAGLRGAFARRLVRAADAFLVHRESTGAKSIIAGYHWFNDWGRDAMVALPGLTLVTRRFQEAREVLFTFARYCRNGLVPNMFPDRQEEPLYNTVDASLWFFLAVYKYLQYTGDFEFVREIYPVLKEIIACYREGTLYGIKMDGDGLIKAGSPGVQLTWMDAKVGDFVVTPRQGKAVEINALWYNALSVFRGLSVRFVGSPVVDELLAKVKESFLNKFWYQEGGYLYDVVNEETKDSALRPNQIFALSLPFGMLDQEKAKKVLGLVWNVLYATYGLRTLAPGQPGYRGVYAGNSLERDLAYHQGTVWSWLTGPFVTALRRVYNYSRRSRIQAARIIAPFRAHLERCGVGFVSEIFDGDEPVKPRGCIAQAWGVAELLRAYAEDVLEIVPPQKFDPF